MDFQDQFIAINFGNISPTVLKKINDFKFLGKKKAAANVLLSMLAKVRALYCQANIFKKLLSLITERRHYKKNVCYKNLLQFRETLSLNRYKKHLSQKD